MKSIACSLCIFHALNIRAFCAGCTVFNDRPMRELPDPCGHGIAPELVAEINALLDLEAERRNVIEWGEWA